MRALADFPTSEIALLVVIPAGFIAAFLTFCALCAIRGGVPRSPRLEALGKKRVVPRIVIEYGYWLLHGMMRPLLVLRVSPDALTVASLLASAGAALAFAVGRFSVGGWLVYLSFICDGLDGLVARTTGVCSDRGEFFDSLIDRYADLLMFLGFAWYYRNDPIPFGIVALAMIVSSVMGYARAKGEALGIDPNVGWMQRPERAAIIGTLTVLSTLVGAFVEPGAAHPRQHLALFGLTVVAIFSNVTAVWRAHYVMARMKRPVRKAPPVMPAEEPAAVLGDERSHAA
jgi:phosphatidylglycerophosphate synthase